MMHTDMEVYKTSMKLVKSIYSITKSFPTDEKWGLTSQMKRAVVSIPSNIAEGCGRKSTKELINFFNISLGSLIELSTQIEIAEMLGFVSNEVLLNDCKTLVASIRRQMLGLMKKYTSSQG